MGNNFGMLREDAGEGVFLVGRGDGNFDALTPADAGFRCVGGQRSVQVVDLDGDGRPDLLVGEYGGTVTQMMNRSSRP